MDVHVARFHVCSSQNTYLIWILYFLVIYSHYYGAANCPKRCNCINTTLICPGWNNSQPPRVKEMDNYEDLDLSHRFAEKEFCKYTQRKVLEWDKIDGVGEDLGPERLGDALAGGRIPAEWLGSVFFVWLRTFQAREARIRLIDKNAFRYQLNLQCVDLSSNELERLNVFTWQRHGALYRLRLTDNHGLQIPEDAPILYSSSLKELYLDSCCLKSVNERTFSAMPKIKIIDLSRNQLTTVKADFFFSVRGIDSLILANNSWVCGCVLKETWYSIRDDSRWQNKLKDLKCAGAKDFTSKRWDELTDEDCIEVPEAPPDTTDATPMVTSQGNDIFTSTILSADLAESVDLTNFIGELTDDCTKFQISTIAIMVFTILIVAILTALSKVIRESFRYHETVRYFPPLDNTEEGQVTY